MSNALKMKKSYKPKNYEDRFNLQRMLRHRAEEDECFCKVFESMQKSNLYVLYYEMDFTKRKITNFNQIIKRNNEWMKSLEDDIREIEAILKKNIGFDCEKEANAFPYRQKIKMWGKNPKQNQIRTVLYNVNIAIESFLVLAVYTLHKNYKFSGQMIEEWWEKMKDFTRLYTDGMKDEHIEQYFKQECNLDLE